MASRKTTKFKTLYDVLLMQNEEEWIYLFLNRTLAKGQ